MGISWRRTLRDAAVIIAAGTIWVGGCLGGLIVLALLGRVM